MKLKNVEVKLHFENEEGNAGRVRSVLTSPEVFTWFFSAVADYTDIYGEAQREGTWEIFQGETKEIAWKRMQDMYLKGTFPHIPVGAWKIDYCMGPVVDLTYEIGEG